MTEDRVRLVIENEETGERPITFELSKAQLAKVERAAARKGMDVGEFYEEAVSEQESHPALYHDADTEAEARELFMRRMLVRHAKQTLEPVAHRRGPLR